MDASKQTQSDKTSAFGWPQSHRRLCPTDRGLADQPHRFGGLCFRRAGAGASCPPVGQWRLGPSLRSRHPVRSIKYSERLAESDRRRAISVSSHPATSFARSASVTGRLANAGRTVMKRKAAQATNAFFAPLKDVPYTRPAWQVSYAGRLKFKLRHYQSHKIKNHQLSWWFDGEPLKAVLKDSATFGMGLWDH